MLIIIPLVVNVTIILLVAVGRVSLCCDTLHCLSDVLLERRTHLLHNYLSLEHNYSSELID